MKSYANLFFCCLFFLISFGEKGMATNLTAECSSKQSLEELYEWMQGSFSSYLQSVEDTDYYNITLQMHPIWKDRSDAKWLYVEQAVASWQHKPYRQRVYKVSQVGKNAFESAVFTLKDPSRFIQNWSNNELFGNLNPDSLGLREGCTIFLKKEGNAYVGSTNEKDCKSTLRGASYATSIVSIEKGQLVSWDQGFNDKDEQVWGAEKEGYTFIKNKEFMQEYPKAKRGDITDTYHGVEVNDPYRWLEDPNSEETNSWIKAQNQLTDNYLSQIPYHKAIKSRLEELWDYEKVSSPEKHGDYYYYRKNDGMQGYSVLYRTDSLNGKEVAVIDPNSFEENSKTSLGQTWFSKDKKYMAYSLSKGGSDWKSFKLMECESGIMLDETLEHIKFSGAAWYKDGFFYGRYTEPSKEEALSVANKSRKIYYHKVGTSQEKDIVAFESLEEVDVNYYPAATTNEKFILLFQYRKGDNGGSIYYTEASRWKEGKVKPLIIDNENDYNYIGQDGDNFLFLTNNGAPFWKLVSINPVNPAPKNWKTIIPETSNAIRSISKMGEKLIVHYMENVVSKIFIYDLDGKQEGQIKLPGIGVANGINTDSKSGEVFYKFESFLYPPTVFRYEMETGESSIYKQPKIDFDFDKYETRQEFYTSKDGTQVPMFITASKKLEKHGKNPTLLYSYGGFNISRIPEFKIENLPFYESGGVYAVANIRGGSEYGENWHKGGMLEKKQNVFDDYIAAAEYLIENGYTRSEKLAATGRSNGGLLVGAVLNQRPDLFGAAIPVVGVMDMLRYQKFTIGWAWISEYGSSEIEDQFPFLYEYSPYHNIKSELDYPPTFVITAVRDDRVVPAHSYKYTAALQYSQQDANPLLLRSHKNAGHRSGRTIDQKIEDWTDRWTFLFNELNIYPSY